MATYKGIDQELNDAKARLDEATKNLKVWEEGENNGKWLNELRGKVRRKEQLDEDDKRQLVRLEEKEKRLEKQVEEWGEALRKFVDGGEGNEQIA